MHTPQASEVGEQSTQSALLGVIHYSGGNKHGQGATRHEKHGTKSDFEGARIARALSGRLKPWSSTFHRGSFGRRSFLKFAKPEENNDIRCDENESKVRVKAAKRSGTYSSVSDSESSLMGSPPSERRRSGILYGSVL